MASLQREHKRVQQCMRRKIAFAKKNGTMADVVGEQYIEFPRAICDLDGTPVKGQKSLVTNYYVARYKAPPNLIMHAFPAHYTPDSVILEGMFLIHVKPLNIHKVMGDYASFFTRRFITPHFKKGAVEVHLLFDNPGCQSENPKVFEQQKRDGSINDHGKSS